MIVTTTNSSSKQGRYNKALSKYENHEYDNSLDIINGLILEDSTNTDYYNLRGKILYELQDTIKSEEDFNKMLVYSTTDSAKEKNIKALIEWDLAHGQEEKAKKLLEEEVELFKSDSLKHIEAVEYAVNSYLALGDTLEAISLYQKLGEENPTTGKFNNYVGVLYNFMGNNKSAIKDFSKAIEAEPDNDQFLYNLGVSYLNIKNKSKAKRYFKKAMELGNKDACKKYRELTAKTKYYKRSRCCDGTTSSALGRGACSHHKGVCRIENVPYKHYTISCN